MGNQDWPGSLYCYKAMIIGVYDADSVTALVDLGFKACLELKIRLSRINAPEVRGKERPLGLAARDYLRDLILDKEVLISTEKDKKGKYGRYLGEIWLAGEEMINVNHHLVEVGHAVFQDY